MPICGADKSTEPVYPLFYRPFICGKRHIKEGNQTLGCPDISFMRKILFLKMQMQGKKRSKVGHLARLFNAADAFSGAKYTRKSKCPNALRPSEHYKHFQTA